MSVKIRLARHGRKQHAYYHIVVANSRAPRDGRFIERIGSYNPNTNPATIDLDFDKAIDWLYKGAQPTDTTRSILSHQGVLMKKHLLDGAKKGAFSEADAEVKFEAWMKEKASKVQASQEKLTSTKLDEKKAKLKAEAKVNEARMADIAKRNAAAAAAKAPVIVLASAQAEAVEAPAAVEKAPVSAPVVEEVAVETVVEEVAPKVVAEEAAAETVVEEVAPEVVVEEVAAETVVEEVAPKVVVEEVAAETVVEEVAPEVVAEEAAPETKVEAAEENTEA